MMSEISSFDLCTFRGSLRAHLNQLLAQWLDSHASQRLLRQFQQSPSQRFEQEQPQLNPCPPTAFDTRYYDTRMVSWDAYIEVQGNRYSVPSSCCGQPVTIRLSLDGELSVYTIQGEKVACHRLVDRKQGWQTVAEHHTVLWQETMPVQQRSLAVYEEVLS
jgi:hypothetical protein